jgi:membrane-associated phospholipid phosphatase
VLAVRFLGGVGFIVPVITVGLGLGAIYGGFHYAVDVVAGVAIGIFGSAAGLFLTGSFRAQANAIAPTYPGSGR